MAVVLKLSPKPPPQRGRCEELSPPSNFSYDMLWSPQNALRGMKLDNICPPIAPLACHGGSGVYT